MNDDLDDEISEREDISPASDLACMGSIAAIMLFFGIVALVLMLSR